MGPKKIAIVVILAFGLLFALSRHFFKRTGDQTPETAVVTDVPNVQSDVENEEPPTSLPKVEGLEITGEKFEPQGKAFMVEEVTIADANGKEIDHFPLLDWGPVKIEVVGKTARVFPNGDIFEIDYKVEGGKVVRTTSCKFTHAPTEETQFAEVISRAKESTPQGESAYSVDLPDLAAAGNKFAYDFFMNPNAEAKQIRAAHGGEAKVEPVIRELTYMKDNGCSW